MKFRFTLLFFALSCVTVVGEVALDFSFIQFIYTLHSKVLDKCVPFVFFILTGLVIDYIVIRINNKKEQEKVATYNATMRAVNQLLRDLMNSMIILSAAESVQAEFGDDITEIIKRNVRKMEGVLESLTGLKEITPEMIRQISTPTER